MRANATLTMLNTISLFGLLCLFAYFCAGQRVERLGLLGYPAVLLITLRQIIARPAPAVAAVARDTAAQRERAGRAVPLARGAALALPVFAAFTALLSSADAVFAGYVEGALRLGSLGGLPELLWRQALILAVAWPLAGVLLFALRKRSRRVALGTPVGAGSLPGTPKPEFSVGFLAAATVLVLIDLLFLVFAWVQFSFLFSGEAARSMGYELYRDYVRRGFGELLLVALLTMGLILGLRWAAWKETEREARIFKVLSSLMIALALVMLVSALMRMIVWENIQYYVNTELRIFVRVFIVWLGLLFGWLLLTIWLRPQRFAIGALLAFLGFLATVNMANPHADVAAYNLRHEDDLATRYAYMLSDDAVPALAKGLETTGGQAFQILLLDLSYRRREMANDPTRHNWQSFHFARDEAYRVLTRLHKEGKID